MNTPPSPIVTFHQFKPRCLESILNLSAPVFTTADDVFAQLRYLEKYVADRELNCKSVVVERTYIDRDYMEDHSAFYSRSLFPYPNYCTRVHFFAIPADEVEPALLNAIHVGIADGSAAHEDAARNISESYLGFAVIRPLQGSPVGRTVLRCFNETPADVEQATQIRRSYDGTRNRRVHLLGVELTVRGLEFQQQDAAVSACATTAIWSSLQKAGDQEEISPATPAQITMLASRYSLPFGRAMPSEGLSLDQMCQAIQAMGLSPSVLRAGDYATARGYVHAAIKSQIVPILILEYKDSYHAVAVAGAKYSIATKPRQDAAENLLGVYVHDDRMGPYRRANLISDDDSVAYLEIPCEPETPEVWNLMHIVTPIYPKNRLGFSGLRRTALHIRVETVRIIEFLLAQGNPSSLDIDAVVDYRVVKPHVYIKDQFDVESTNPEVITSLLRNVRMPRYLGLVRVSSNWFDEIDLLIDTTNTLRNAQCVAVVIWGEHSAATNIIGKYLAERFECSAFGID